MAVSRPVPDRFQDAGLHFPLHAPKRPTPADNRLRRPIRQVPPHRRLRGLLVRLADNIAFGAPDATQEQIDGVQAELDSDSLAPLISDLQFDSAEQAYQEAIDLLGDEYDGILTADQIGAQFRITLADPTKSAVISEAFGGTDGVEEVKDQLQYLEPLFSALTVATYVAVGIAGLMLIAAVLLISTTIRLSAYARRRELGIMRLVGASNRFIQTPFILEGVFAALIGSVLCASKPAQMMMRFGWNFLMSSSTSASHCVATSAYV